MVAATWLDYLMTQMLHVHPFQRYCTCSIHWRLTYPLKTSYAGEPGHIPLIEIDSGTCFKIEVCKVLVRPKGSEVTQLINLLLPSMKRVAFQPFLTRSASSPFSIYRSMHSPGVLSGGVPCSRVAESIAPERDLLERRSPCGLAPLLLVHPGRSRSSNSSSRSIGDLARTWSGPSLFLVSCSSVFSLSTTAFTTVG